MNLPNKTKDQTQKKSPKEKFETKETPKQG